MKNRLSRTSRSASITGRFGCCSFLIAALVACESTPEPKPLTSSDEPKAAASNPMVSPEIAEAVAQVEQAPTAGAEDGPPESGILGVERAQKDAPAGAPPKVVLGKPGDAPRVALGGPQPTDERIGQMSLMVRTGPNSGMPGVSFKFELAKQAPPKDAPPGPELIGVEIMDAALSTEQLGDVPAEIGTAIGTMKGSVLSYRTQDGAMLGDVAIELGKKTDTRMNVLLASAGDVFNVVMLSVPKEPVGKGGFWMVTQRERLSLGEVVGYHLVTVADVQPGRVTLSVNTKRYLVSAEFQGLPALQFMGAAQTDMVMAPGERLPVEGRTQQSLQAVVQREGSNPRPLMFDMRALFAFPPKGGAAPGGAAPAAPGGAAPGGAAPAAPAAPNP